MPTPKVSMMLELEIAFRAYARAKNLSFSSVVNQALFEFYQNEIRKEFPNLPAINFELGRKPKANKVPRKEYFKRRNELFSEYYKLMQKAKTFICDRCKKEIIGKDPHYIALPNGDVLKLCDDCYYAAKPKSKMVRYYPEKEYHEPKLEKVG
jgi:hypothetical protein